MFRYRVSRLLKEQEGASFVVFRPFATLYFSALGPSH